MKLKNNSLVSVVIPTYNRAHCINQALTSLVRQSYRPLEILVVDDGSEDETHQVVERFISMHADHDLLFKLLYQKNAGAPTARNLGIKHSSGEYIQFHASDDTMDVEKISNQVSALKKRVEFGFAYGSWGVRSSHLIDKGPLHQLKPYGCRDAMLRGYLSTRWFCPEHSYLFRRNVVDTVGDFDPTLRQRQDTDYLIRVLSAGFEALFVENSIVYYHRHKGDHIGNRKNFSANFASMLSVIEKAYTWLSEQKLILEYESEVESYFRLLAINADNYGFADELRQLKNAYRKLTGEDLHYERGYAPFLYSTRQGMLAIINKSLGPCGVDWLKKMLGKLEYN